MIATTAFATDRNISSSGATCNGSTDDAAAVQTAINAAVAGDRVVVSAGCMAAIGSAGIHLTSKNNVQLVGLGAGAGFRALATTYGQSMNGISWTVMLLVRGCTNCAVRTLEFDMNNQGAAAIGMDTSSGVVIDGNNIHDVGDGVVISPSAAVQAASNTNCQYTNNTVLHARGNYSLHDGTRGIWVGNNGSNDTGALISGNHITDTWHSGIVTFCVNCITDSNVVYDSGTGATHSKGGGACQKENYPGVNAITNNSYTFCSQGIQISYPATPTTGSLLIQYNTFRNLNDGTVTTTDTYGGRHVNVLNNTIVNVNNGLELNSGDDILFKNNTCTDDGAAGEQRTNRCLRITSNNAPISNVTVDHNDILVNSQQGGMISDASGNAVTTVAVTNNKFAQSARWGLEVVETTAGTVTGITQSGNCFTSNTLGSIRDTRGLLPNPSPSGSCASAIESTQSTKMPGGHLMKGSIKIN